jgi:hypothetical protein
MADPLGTGRLEIWSVLLYYTNTVHFIAMKLLSYLHITDETSVSGYSFASIWHYFDIYIKAEIYLVGVNATDYNILNRCNKGKTINLATDEICGHQCIIQQYMLMYNGNIIDISNIFLFYQVLEKHNSVDSFLKI